MSCVFQVLIPISLYVSIEIVKVCQVYFINQDVELYDEETDSQLQCRALNITEDLGQIQYIFSDKTGTLTENKMVFRRCTVSGIEYSHDANGEWVGRGSWTRKLLCQSCMHKHTCAHSHSHTCTQASGIADFRGRIQHRRVVRELGSPKPGGTFGKGTSTWLTAPTHCTVSIWWASA